MKSLLLLLLALVVKVAVLLPTSPSEEFRLMKDRNTSQVSGSKFNEVVNGNDGKIRFSMKGSSMMFFLFNETLTTRSSVELKLDTSSKVHVRAHRCNWNSSLGIQSSGTVTLLPHVKRSMLEQNCSRDKNHMIFSLESTAPATGTLELKIAEFESFYMIVVVVVFFLTFVGIAVALEYKNSKSFTLSEQRDRVQIELVSMREVENRIEETAV
ncbi:hypothetical protein B9Z55_025299 [Caenorhabditis nigoni]|uniref:Uncharacterized protein n=1 Tax=Caenorhabditis nigoni TaxID=1611254 RepID=A0A2G5SY87_9PELO|nr:hypothetical protein B9Z55_025299 [Caenorhabditis nigoni]